MGGNNRATRIGALVLLLAIAANVLAADNRPAQVLGNWLTENKDGIIRITAGANGVYQGRIVGGNHPGRLDVKNPDPRLRNNLLQGEIILRNLRYDGEGKWSGGTIYDPNNGRNYRCVLEILSPNSLKLRGFIGFSLLGRSQIWTRYLGTSMDLPSAP